MEEHKVVILGSGIAGMTAGIYLKRGGLDVLVVEYPRRSIKRNTKY